MTHHEPTRLTIILDIDEANPDLILIRAGHRAVKLIDELWHHGLNANIHSININGKATTHGDPSSPHPPSHPQPPLPNSLKQRRRQHAHTSLMAAWSRTRAVPTRNIRDVHNASATVALSTYEAAIARSHPPLRHDQHPQSCPPRTWT